MIICFEGTDKSGKTLQACMIKDYLENIGYKACYVHDPRDDRVSRMISDIIFKEKLSTSVRSYLFISAKSYLIEKINKLRDIKDIIILDRFILSTMVYQGDVGGFGDDKIWDLFKSIPNNFIPDLTLYFDVEPITVYKRMVESKKDEVEKKYINSIEEIRNSYLSYRNDDRIKNLKVVDANGSISDVFSNVKSVVDKYLGDYFSDETTKQ